MERNLPDEISNLSKTVELLVDVIGKVANSQQALSLYDSMEKDMVPDDFASLKTDVAVLVSKVDQWMTTTAEHRQQQGKKIDFIYEKVTNLPCSERKSWYVAMGNQMKVMWGFLGAIILAVIVEWIRNH